MNLGECGYKIEFNSRAGELGGRFEIRRVGVLRFRIRGSSSNIIDEFGGDRDNSINNRKRKAKERNPSVKLLQNPRDIIK